MEIKAISRYLRISPKKTRLVADVIRGLEVTQAENQLRFIPRKASQFIIKTLHSAIANAEHNFGLKKENLYIKKIVVNEGPAIKRWMPKAFGRATPIRKRSSHIEIILDEIKPEKAKKKIAEIETRKAAA
ncbi:MAG: 50S ribosomal protein L22, partial [Patescibacteria group bacterium]